MSVCKALGMLSSVLGVVSEHWPGQYSRRSRRGQIPHIQVPVKIDPFPRDHLHQYPPVYGERQQRPQNSMVEETVTAFTVLIASTAYPQYPTRRPVRLF